MKTKRATNLRQQAAHRVCQVRLPGCQHTNCCLAHVRLSGISGMGLKAPDLLGAWACDACHKAYDVHGSTDLERDFVDKAFLEGVIRTQAALVKEGWVTW